MNRQNLVHRFSGMRTFFITILMFILVSEIGHPEVLAQHSSSQAFPLPLSWIKIYQPPISFMGDIKASNEKLYLAGQYGQENGHIYEYDGATWKDLQIAAKTGANILTLGGLASYEGSLFIGAKVLVNGTRYSRIYRYTGTTFLEELTAPFEGEWDLEGFSTFLVHNGTLYAGMGNRSAQVYRRESSGSWVSTGSLAPYETIWALASFNGSLYAGSGVWMSGAKVWRLDENGWTLVKNISTDLNDDSSGINDMVVYGGKMYISLGLYSCTSSGSTYIVEFDGTSWSTSGSFEGSCPILFVNDDRLWVAPTHSPNHTIYVYDGSTWSPFTSINENILFRRFAEYKGLVIAAVNDPNYSKSFIYGGFPIDKIVYLPTISNK
jgi:hypothetical protein